jgi:hypothetical protein
VAHEADYDGLLTTLAQAAPLISADLKTASEQRRVRLEAYLAGRRLKGVEQLNHFLIEAERSYRDKDPTAPFAFLVRRVRADFQTALEAALSGYGAVALDAMRDVMEIEGLLLLFASETGSGEQWIACDSRTRWRLYAPVKVRERLKKSGVPPFSNNGYEPVDYQAHSESLHVTPLQAPHTLPGPAPGYDGLLDDIPFVEMFEHGHRIMWAIEIFRVVAQELSEDEYQPLSARADFDEAYGRTRQMQSIIVAFVGVPAQLQRELGRPPTTSDVLFRVADLVRASSEGAEPDTE